MTALQILTFVAIAVVLGVLGFGLFNLMRGGPPNRSQKLMRARVLLQLLAIIVMMTALYISQNS